MHPLAKSLAIRVTIFLLPAVVLSYASVLAESDAVRSALVFGAAFFGIMAISFSFGFMRGALSSLHERRRKHQHDRDDTEYDSDA